MKYELTDEFITTQNGVKLFRIKALESFSDVKEGDLGGFIEKESNLSQKGRSWVYDDAKVYEDAKVYGHAQVFGEAEIYGNANIYGNAKVHDSACIYDYSRIYDNANVSGKAQVYDNAEIYGESKVYDAAHVYGNAKIYGDAEIYCKACVFDDAHIYGNAKVFNEAWVCEGKWSTSPFYLRLKEHDITSCSFTQLKIGCSIYSIDELKKRGEEIGRENGYSDETIELYKQAVELAEKHIKNTKTE